MVDRDSYSQHEYREQSRSENKDTQHASHILSIERANEIQSHAHGPASQDLSDSINSSDNMRMKSSEANTKDDRQLDRAQTEKSKSGEILTQREESRARQAVGFLQSHQDEIPKGFQNAAKEEFKSLETSNRKTLWDSRKDKQ